jgi:adenylate cyclase
MDLPSDADRVVRVSGGPAPRDVRRAIEYMRRNVGRRIAMADLVAVCHVSERTLRKHFRTFIGVSPLGFLRRLRLAAVREALLKGTRGTSVTEVATLHGFTHFGRFSSQYRQCFGETPSITLGRSRAAREERSDRTDRTGGRETQRHDALGVLGSRERPSVVVVSCRTSTLEPTHQFFAEGLAEGIATVLCRVRSISVLEAASAKRALYNDPQRLAQELGARYFLTGRLTQTRERIRIIIRLLETATNAHIWGDSYEGEASDLFGLQNRVTEGVVKAILPNIRGAEIDRARRKRPEDLDAYDLTMRAFSFVFASNPNATRQALDLLHRAIEIDPDYALATALAAWGHAQLVVHNATPSPGEEKKRALQLAERAGILDLDDPQVLTARCAVHTVAGQFDVAGTLIDRALAVDPLSGWAWERSGWLKTFSGQPEAGLAHLGRAIHLDPSCPSNANRLVGFGCAYFDAGRYEDAAFWLRRALQEQPSTVWANRSLCVSYARLGERLAALDSLDALRRYCPGLTIGQVLASLPFTPDFMGRIAEGLNDLGLPP